MFQLGKHPQESSRSAKDQAGTVASSRAATPGSSFPSSSSRDAPPPVLQWDTFSTVLYFLQAVAVSPPPITEMAPAAVTSKSCPSSSWYPPQKLPFQKLPWVHSRRWSLTWQLRHHSALWTWGRCLNPKIPLVLLCSCHQI